MYNTGKSLYYKIIIAQLLDGAIQTVIELSLLDAFTATGTTYNAITVTELSLYSDLQYNIRYSAFIKYINDTYYTGFQNSILPVDISGDTTCLPTTTAYVPTTTGYAATTTNYTPTTTVNLCVQISEQLGWSAVSGSDACTQVRDIYYGNDASFAATTKISASNTCLPTLGGYYSNGSIWKYTFDGINFITQGTCGSVTTTVQQNLGTCYNIVVPYTELSNGGTLYIDYYPYGGSFTSMPHTAYPNNSGDPNFYITDICSTQQVYFRRNGMQIVIPTATIIAGTYGCTNNNQCNIF